MSYWTNYLVQRHLEPTDDGLWRIPLIVQTAPGGMLLLGMCFLYETPRCLCASGKVDRAQTVLAKYRGWDRNDSRVEEEIQEILCGLHTSNDKPLSWHHVFAPANRRRLLFGCALQFFQQMTGTNVINYYSPIIFRSIGLSSNTTELLATGVYGVVKMMVTLIGFSCLVDTFGRRPLLVGGGLAMSLCMMSVAICIGIQTPSAASDAVAETTSSSAYAVSYLFYYVSRNTAFLLIRLVRRASFSCTVSYPLSVP